MWVYAFSLTNFSGPGANSAVVDVASFMTLRITSYVKLKTLNLECILTHSEQNFRQTLHANGGETNAVNSK